MSAHPFEPTIALGHRIRRSPYFEATLRWGVKQFTVYNHVYMPTYFKSPEADYWKLIENATLWDVAGERQVEISGPDAARFTQLLTPRDISKCRVGQAKYVLICDEHGGIINDPVLLKLAGDRFWLSLADYDILLWAQGVAVNAGMDVQIGEPDVSPLQLQGPRAHEIMLALVGKWIESLKFYRFREFELGGIPLIISRTGWSGERGYELFLRDGSRGDELWERIMAAGKPFGIAPGAPNQIRRIEAGLYSWGLDMDAANNPFEIGLDWLVDLDADIEFIGKSALQRIAATGVAQKLVGIELDGDAAPCQCVPLNISGQRGRTVSTTWSPRLKRNIGFAYLPAALASNGSHMTVHGRDGDVAAQVVPTPFDAPRYRD